MLRWHRNVDFLTFVPLIFPIKLIKRRLFISNQEVLLINYHLTIDSHCYLGALLYFKLLLYDKFTLFTLFLVNSTIRCQTENLNMLQFEV